MNAPRRPAGGAAELRRRARRFLDRERRDDPPLAQLLDGLALQGEVWLFGGALRDLALLGAPRDGADLDLVCEGDVRAVALPSGAVPLGDSRLGGRRARTRRWAVDFWAAGETWAVRAGLVEYAGVESLLRTTISNWESALWRLSDGRLLCADGWFEDLAKGRLDVVLRDSPNPLGMAVRLVRACAGGRVRELSPAAAAFIGDALAQWPFERLSAHERARHRETLIDRAAWEALRAGRWAPRRSCAPGAGCPAPRAGGFL